MPYPARAEGLVNLIRYVSRVKWSNPGKRVAPPLNISVVAIENGAFWSPSTTVANFTLNRLIGLVGRVFANGPENLGSQPGRVIPKTSKMVLVCLTLSNIRYVSRVKWSNPGKGLVSSPTPRCSIYWKRSLPVALDYSRQLTMVDKPLTQPNQIIYTWCIMYKKDLTLNNMQWLIFHKTKPNRTKSYIYIYTLPHVVEHPGEGVFGRPSHNAKSSSK